MAKTAIEAFGQEYQILFVRPGCDPIRQTFDNDLFFVVPRVGEYVILEPSEGPKVQEWLVSKVTHETVVEQFGIKTYIHVYLTI